MMNKRNAELEQIASIRRFTGTVSPPVVVCVSVTVPACCLVVRMWLRYDAYGGCYIL